MFPSRTNHRGRRMRRRPGPTAPRRIAWERLEDRTLLSNLPLDGPITNAVEQANGVVQSAFTTLDSNLFGILGAGLPLVGNNLKFLEQGTHDLFAPIGGALSSEFKSLGQTIYDTDVENAIATALKSLGVNAPTLQPITDTVTANQTGTAIDDMELHLDIKGTLVDSQSPVNFDTGLSSLNLKLTGNVALSLGYELQLGLGVNDNGFYIDGPTTSFALTLGASAPGLKLSGQLAFLQVDASDGTAAGTSGFNATLGVALTDSSDHISLSNNTPLDLSASLTAAATAQVHLHIKTSFDGSAEFPSIDADFDMSWTIDAGTALDGSSNAGSPTFGETPDIAFHNISLDVGSFLDKFVGPIVAEVKKVLDPLQPVIDVFNTRIPVLSDIAPLKSYFNVPSNEPVTLLNVITALDQGADTKFLTAVVALDQLVNNIPSVGSGVSIPLGGFDFGANNVNARTANLAQTPLTSVNANPQAILKALGNVPGVGGFVSQITSKIQFGGDGSPDDGGGLQFPLIEDPQLGFGLLLGQDVPLFTFDMPTLKADATFHKSFPLLGPLGVLFRGTVQDNLDPNAPQDTAIEFLLHFSFGYDTHGLVQFAKDNFALADIGDLLDGFYVSTTDQPDGSGSNFVPQIRLYAGLGAFAAIDLAVFSAGVGGGISGDILVKLHNPNKVGKLRWSDLVAELSSGGPLSLFDVSGALTAELEAFIQIGFQTPFGFVGYENSDDIAQATLLNFNLQAQGDPIPVLATPNGGVLRLNIGQFANQRQVGDLSDHDESFTVSDGGASPNGPGERVIVSAYGYEQTYDNVTEIDAFCGPGDSITINPGVTANAVLTGGDGKNHLVYDGSGTATLSASGADNVLSGGAGPNTLDASQATGGDTLIGGTGPDLFKAATAVPLGGPGDLIQAGPKDDTVYGGAGVRHGRRRRRR